MLSLLSPRLTMWIIIGLLLSNLVTGGIGWWKTNSLEKQVLAAQAEVAQAKVDLATSQANEQALKATIRDQNRAIADLRQKASAAESAARVRAVETLRDGERTRREIEAMPGTGPDVMNGWLREVFR